MSKVRQLAEAASRKQEAREQAAHLNNCLLALCSNAPGGKLFVPHAAIRKLGEGDGAEMHVDDLGITLTFRRAEPTPEAG